MHANIPLTAIDVFECYLTYVHTNTNRYKNMLVAPSDKADHDSLLHNSCLSSGLIGPTGAVLQ